MPAALLSHLTEARLQKNKSAQKPLLSGPQIHELRCLFAVFLLPGPLSFNPDWIPWLIFPTITVDTLLLSRPLSVFSYLPGKNLPRLNPAFCLLRAYPWAATISWRKIPDAARPGSLGTSHGPWQGTVPSWNFSSLGAQLTSFLFSYHQYPLFPLPPQLMTLLSEEIATDKRGQELFSFLFQIGWPTRVCNHFLCSLLHVMHELSP